MTLPLTLPPIIERELRVASRRGATYWSRVGAASSGIIILCWVFAVQLAAAPAPMAGQMTFRLLAGIAALTTIGSVLRLSSEAFAREKREDTLGLLFLTPLKPIDLVLGKLVSASLAAFYRFLAMVPLLALPMIVGGVAASDFILIVLGLVNCIFLAATLGLYVSARSWDERRAGIIARASMLGLALLPALAVALMVSSAGRSAFFLFALSPAYPIWRATVTGAMNSGLFWASLAWTHILGWIFFCAACRNLPRCWQDRPMNAAPTGEHLQRRAQQEVAQQPVATRNFQSANPAAVKVRRSVHRQFAAHERARMLDFNPVLWLAMRGSSNPSGPWIVGAIGLVIPAVTLITGYWGNLISPGLALIVFFCVNAGFKIYVATQAAFAFARDRTDNPLELLLSSPITPRQLVDGHLLGLRETLRPWIRRALWIEGAWLSFTITLHTLSHGGGTWLYVLASLAVLGFLIPDLYAVSRTALWHGVTARNAREAEQEAFTRVLFLPWIPAFLVWWAIVSIAGPVGGLVAMIVSWMLSSAAADWWFARRACHHLETRLILWALRRSAGEFEHYDGWRRLGRWLGRRWRRP